MPSCAAGVFVLLAFGVVTGALMLIVEVLHNLRLKRRQLAQRVVSQWRRRAREKRELRESLARLDELRAKVAAATREPKTAGRRKVQQED